MDSKQESKLNMYRTVENICDTNISLISTIAAFLAAYNNFKDIIATIISTASSESLVLSGITIDKAVLKKNLCQSATDLAALIFAYASSIGNNTLKQQVNFAFTDFNRLKDDELVPAVQNILIAADTNMAALADFGVTAAGITDLQNIMNDYSTAVPKPRSAKALKETYSKNLKLLIKQGDDLLKNQMDKFVANFKNTQPDFVSTYKAARVIIDPSKSTTQIKGNVSSETGEEPVGNATVQIIGLTAASVTTNAEGFYVQKPVIPGIYEINVIAVGFQPKNITGVEAQLGKTTTLDIQLTPLV